MTRLTLTVVAVVLAAVLAAGAYLVGARSASGLAGLQEAAQAAQARGLKPNEVTFAVQSFVPPGRQDEYLMFSSAGHGGQVLVIGLPSMRLLKVLAAFSTEPWQGFGYGADWSQRILEEGANGNGVPLTWGDTHHPALSETNGEYDGRWLYINDRANGRIAMIDLRDFKVKQILKLPNMQTNHGGVFATPNTDYVHVSSKIPMVWGGGYAPLEQYKERYRGVSAWLAVDKQTGRVDLSRSFQIELPPYNQDLADAGKLASDGWGFINSYNTEMATGGNMEGKPAIEAGASARDFDFLHIINWKKAEEVVAAGKFEMRNGIRVIPLKTAIAEGLLYFAPEPRSPHGVDVAPNGKYIVVSGKLDPHTTVYDIDKIKAAIAAKHFEGTDPFGVPILKFDAVVAARVAVGNGPLHTQFDERGYAYTSLFVDSAVAKWTLGEPYFKGDAAWKLVDKVSVHYNIGHLATAEGDTVSPDGRYLVALNKWSVDRYPVLGPLHPQNFQLVDLTAPKMRVVYDMPIPNAEPHYAQIIKADKIQAWQVYPAGTDIRTMQRSPYATERTNERVERTGNVVTVWMTAARSNFRPDIVRVKQGDTVVLHITNTEKIRDATHGFAIPEYNIQMSIDPGETVSVKFVASRAGAFSFYCTEFCSALHLEMQGWL
ncbi:MAG: Sec-dependent nitrous-oxide reductase, partial [Armatimonadota bacterium]|nr:Sec-dependent nitrous-oxide reductase [Armatimonadota bacterium]